ncbi:MAG TPA: carboxypeptidase-like regulatory domain-containing protein, partial [Chitinophagaceae bacterium]|nr:carboxypeptidase-like regulatory domain-containing protein [Chitinophagaceae bacterium]
MRRVLALFILSFLFSAVTAQKPGGNIKGLLLDTTVKQPITDATISVFQADDSSLVTSALSNKEGFFEIKGLVTGEYQLIITHQAFLDLKKRFSVTDDKMLVDFGQISLSKDYKTLGEVIITNESPILVKDDTIQFNTSGFKTPPNATVEDLLKKLPGVEVDKEGNVKSQGEEVQKIYIDGKEFFGNDPKLATKNLTADMVESIQVFEDMSDQAK